MKVSVVSIAKNKNEFKQLIKDLKKQTFRNWEFVYSTKKGIPQAWNDAISKASGEIIVTTDSDVKILSNKWLEDIVNAVKKYNKNDPKKRTIIKGIEIHPNQPWTWCNVACYANVLKENKVDETHSITEDTELFSRLRILGYKGLELPIAPILHKRIGESKNIIKRSFKYGFLNTKINLKYGFLGFKNNKKKASEIFKREMSIIFSRLLYLLGVLIGFIFFKFKLLKTHVNEKYRDWREEQKEVYDEMVRRSKALNKHTIIYPKSSLDTLNKIVPKKGKILDVGCGTGHYAEVLNDRNWAAGIDISPQSIKVAKKFYKEVKVADVTKHIPFPDNSFDYIFALSLFHHIYQYIPEALKEMKRVLKPDGEIIIIDHDARNVHRRNLTSGLLSLTPTKSEKTLYPEELFKFIKDAGFKIKKVKLLRIDGYQQALVPNILIRLIKVPLLCLLDIPYYIAGKKYPGEILIIAKPKK